MDVIESIHTRWSPREYLPVKVDLITVYKIFETARWAQSSNNEQPWRYLIAPLGNPGRTALEDLLAEGNAYAKQAGILGLACAKKTFTRDGSHNRTAQHDLGAASQLISLAARAHGLSNRFMAGFSVERARELCPGDYEPVAMFAIGKAVSDIPPKDRARREVAEFVSIGSFDTSFM